MSTQFDREGAYATVYGAGAGKGLRILLVGVGHAERGGECYLAGVTVEQARNLRLALADAIAYLESEDPAEPTTHGQGEMVAWSVGIGRGTAYRGEVIRAPNERDAWLAAWAKWSDASEIWIAGRAK